MKKNKPVLFFLLRFFVSYFILSGIYQWYLNTNQQTQPQYNCCGATGIVASNTATLGHFLGFEFKTKQSPDELSYKIFIKDNYIARVVEGCNAISVIVLFWAFIIAFTGSWKNTLLFGFLGSALIYALNIIRIVLLSVALDKYPQHSNFLHQIVFPAIIYGFTFLLWIVWVKYFTEKSGK